MRIVNGEFDVGVPIVLTVGPEPSDVWPSGQSPRYEIEWTCSRATLPCGGFEATESTGRWQDLQLGQDPRIFRFVPRRGGREIVTARVRQVFSGGLSYEEEPIQWDIRIRAPQLQPQLRANVDRVAFVERDDDRYKGVYLQAGRQTSSTSGMQGITKIFAVDANKASGHIGVVQLIASYRLNKNRDQREWLSSTNGRFVLDNLPRFPGIIYRNVTTALGDDAEITFSDSPAQLLSGSEGENYGNAVLSLELNENFRTILVFKSNRHQRSCWVPLQTVTWGWTASVRAQENEWRFFDERILPPVEPETDVVQFGWSDRIDRIPDMRLR